MSFKSGLKKFGEDLLKIITIGAVVAKDSAPFVSTFNPALALLLNGSATAILAAETAGAAAVNNAPGTDTGLQKAALAAAAIKPLAQSFCKTLGLSDPTDVQVQKFNDYLVAGLNVFGLVEQDVATTIAAPAAAPAAAHVAAVSNLAATPGVAPAL